MEKWTAWLLCNHEPAMIGTVERSNRPRILRIAQGTDPVLHACQNHWPLCAKVGLWEELETMVCSSPACFAVIFYLKQLGAIEKWSGPRISSEASKPFGLCWWPHNGGRLTSTGTAELILVNVGPFERGNNMVLERSGPYLLLRMNDANMNGLILMWTCAVRQACVEVCASTNVSNLDWSSPVNWVV